MAVSVRHLRETAHIYVDGRRVAGELEVNESTAKIGLASVPTPGMHLLQLQNPNGLFSNDFIFYVAGERTKPSGAED